jgi:hypothetical protein
LNYRIFTTHDGQPRPMIYSNGEDGLDSTAQRDEIPPPEPQFEWARTADQWRDLTRFAPPPTTLPMN